MLSEQKWIANEEAECIRNLTNHLHIEAKRLMIQDGTHANVLFLFSKENGLISVNQIPPNVESDQLNEAIKNTIAEHNLYGVVLIAETWTYSMKEKDHTTFQILDGEMKVSDLNAEDKKEALMVRMETRDGASLIYLDQIVKDENGTTLKNGIITEKFKSQWFTGK